MDLGPRADVWRIAGEADAPFGGEGPFRAFTWLILSFAELTCRMLQGMLADSMRDSCLRTVHETLLVRYAQLALDGLSVGSDGDRDDAATRGAGVVRRIAHMYLPTGRVWAAVFEAADAGGMCVLRGVYDMWMLTDVRAATLAWGTWLLGQGRINDFYRVLQQASELASQWHHALAEEKWMIEGFTLVSVLVYHVE